MTNNSIFISFSNKDLEIVAPVVSIIEEYGIKCWFQPNNSKNNFHEGIPTAIENSKYFICFVSKESIHSIRVNNEIEIALDKYNEDNSYTILPIEIEELSGSDRRRAKGVFGTFTWLYKKNYNDIYSLVLTTFSQIGIQRDETEIIPSIYTGDEQIEINRLLSQNNYLNKIANPYLDIIFSKYDKPNILDIGCADGYNTISRLGGRNYNYLLGLDKNEKKIASAKISHTTPKDDFRLCDIESDKLDIVLSQYSKEKKIKGFDIIHIAAVLMHMNKPGDFLKKIYNYLSPGGTIFIQDEDDGFNVSYPNNKLIDSCRDIWKYSKESGDRHMGRKIPKLLTDSGFTNISLLSSTVSSLDFEGEMKEILWDIYYNSDFWVTDNPSFFSNIEAYNAYERYKENHSKLKEQYMKGDFFVTLGILFFSAQKPQK